MVPGYDYPQLLGLPLDEIEISRTIVSLPVSGG